MRWEIIDADEEVCCSTYGIGPLLGKLLTASEADDDQIRELLSGDTRLTTSNAECLVKACQRILKAARNHEMVFVGGDYDADGICSTAIMKKTLDKLRIKNGYYIPDRFKEGYGLSAATVELAVQKGYTLIMTVDNGVKAHEAIRRANELGVDIIITDHHRIEEEIETEYVVHPDYMEPEYEYLSGAGVALQISRYLTGEDDSLTAMAAVAAVADVMPLWRETRKIVRKGMDILKKGRPASLKALFIPGSAVNETTIAFQVVPKLNSVGRMNDISNVNTVVKYLLSENERVISDYAAQLNMVNDRRKELSASETKMAEEYCSDDEDFLLIRDERFHEGICGLTAGRIAAAQKKPVLVMAKNGDLWKGSGRSVPGFDLFAFFSSFSCLASFGGHEQAVGISVHQDDFEEFCHEITRKMEEMSFVFEESVQQAVRISEYQCTMNNILDLEQASPYPKELFQPNFALCNCHAEKVQETAKVTRYRLENGMEAILYKRKGLPSPDHPERLIGRLSVNRWRNRITLQMEIEDIQ